MRYRLNFKGFSDTPEMLFGHSITEALTDVDFGDIDNVLTECILNIKNKLGININRDSITGIQFTNQEKFAAEVMVIGQDEYLLLVNPNKILNEDALVSSIYHELCHVYQLNKLFTNKLMTYNRGIVANGDENVFLLLKHLNANGGHTEYWRELADKINQVIKPIIEIKPYLEEDLGIIQAELFEEDYFELDFDNTEVVSSEKTRG